MSFLFRFVSFIFFFFFTVSSSVAAVENCDDLKRLLGNYSLPSMSDETCKKVNDFYVDGDRGEINLDTAKEVKESLWYTENKKVVSGTCYNYMCTKNDLYNFILDIANGERGESFSNGTITEIAKNLGFENFYGGIEELRSEIQKNLKKNIQGEYYLPESHGYVSCKTHGPGSLCSALNNPYNKVMESINNTLDKQETENLENAYLSDENFLELMKILAEDKTGEDLSEMTADDFMKYYQENKDKLEPIVETIDKLNQGIGKFYKTSVYEKTLAKWRETGGCWVCPLFSDLFDTANWVATNIYETLRLPVLMLFSVGLALWLAFKVMQYVTTFYGANFAKFITEISGVLFKGIIVGVLLNSGSGILSDYILSPLVGAATGYSEEVLSITDDFYSSLSEANDNVLGSNEALCERNKRPVPDNADKMVFGEEIHNDLSCLIRKISAKLLNGMSIGTAMLITLFSTEHFWEVLYVFQYPDVLFVSMIIILAHVFLLIVFPFRLIEVFIRFAVVGALLPIFIITWPFPSTRGIAESGKNIFITSLFTLIGLVVFITIGVEMILYSMPGDMVIIFSTGEDKKNVEILKYYRELFDLGKMLMIPLSVFFSAYMAAKMLNMVPEMSKKIFGSKLAKTAGSGVEGAAFGAVTYAPKKAVETYKQRKQAGGKE